MELSESGDVLKTLLSFIYPGPRTRPGSWELLSASYHAAEKYKIQCVIDSLRGYFASPAFLASHALAIYSLARGLQPDDEAQNAMDILYSLDLDVLISEDMSGIPADGLAAVLKAREVRAALIIKRLGTNSTDFGRPYCSAVKGQPA
ncbi:hypothetical protein CALVIDRAFT_559543 [Calocera viscosa TUFC12733]|uniref:BTB domain-containing protein n=1 Tax=Calocera viscosa (strain TUFC12733) TaxID=1330018 RepID=A0A167SB31_CALVF|nr:hypothetical protein CALVIDRAFT_559543 [Calocera viscosa TUFC12733]